MATLSGKLGTWTLPHVHMWKDRGRDIRAQHAPCLRRGTKIATIGSCFAAELAASMQRFGLLGQMHPAGLFYNSRSIRQEIERIFGGWPKVREEECWKVPGGFVHPFKLATKVFATQDEMMRAANAIDEEANRLFQNASVVVITLGLIEAWKSRTTGNTFMQIPHPAVFDALSPEFYRLTVQDIVDDLETVYAAIVKRLGAKLILTVSPVPLHATLTPFDIRVANTESKCRIRAAVSEFIERRPDVHYFHSYELVTTAERLSDFMMDDGRHVHRHAVDYILTEFLRAFGDPNDIVVPTIDTSWLVGPSKTAARPSHPKPTLLGRVRSRVRRTLKRTVPSAWLTPS